MLLQNSQHRAGQAKDDRQDNLEESLALLLRNAAGHEDEPARREELHGQAQQLVESARRATRLASADLEDDG